jgi:S-(hydroxymethyl)glutathione dehydrogenase/alcohol dehydrogenase
MKTRAAVAFEAGKPLEIAEVDLEGPESEGEVLVEIKATGICHTDAFTLSGDDPEGAFPAILGHEGAAWSSGNGPRRDQREARRSRHPAVHARVPRVRILPAPEDQPVPGDPRDPGPGPDAGRHQPLLLDGKPILHYMGCSTFSNYTVLPEIAVAKVRPTRPSTRSATSAAA